MRNLKRALSLMLASVMLLGMMVVGAGAAQSYPDVDYDNDNVEAIEVLQAINVMTGHEGTGNFGPGEEVTRGQMARIMAALMDLDYEYYTSSNPFTDMNGHWAEAYAAACYANGIIAGRTTTTYDPEATVTAVEAAAMLMRALGYFQNKDVDYPDGFVVATVRQAGKIDLFNGVAAKTNEPMTRNDVAQLILNTLKSGMVEPDGSSFSITTPDGFTVAQGATNYVYVTSRDKYAWAIRDVGVENATASTALQAPIVELGEKLYQGDLVLEDAAYKHNTDDFGRPADTWTYKNEEIGTYYYEADESLTFTAKVTPKKLYNAVGRTAAEKYEWTIYLNGDPQEGYVRNDDGAPKLLSEYQIDDNKDFYNRISSGADTLTGNGVLTQVYVEAPSVANGNKGTVTVAITKYYAAEVYKMSDGKITLVDLDNGCGKLTSNHEFATSDFSEDEIVYYTFANDKIQSVEKAERIEGEVTKVVAKFDDEDGNNFNLDTADDAYKYNITMTLNRLLTENVDNGMVGYLDGNGYVIYIDMAAVSYDYAYVLAMQGTPDPFGNGVQSYGARMLLADGTILTVSTDYDEEKYGGAGTEEDPNPNYPENHIVSYVKGSDNVYTLTIRDKLRNDSLKSNGTDGLETIPFNGTVQNVFTGEKAPIRVNGKTYVANSNTVFLIADPDGDNINNWIFTVYTGVMNAPTIDVKKDQDAQICVAATSGNVARVVYVQNADISGNTDVTFVVAEKGDLTYASGGTKYYPLSAVQNGELVTLNVKDGSKAWDKLINNVVVNFNTGSDYAGTALPVDNISKADPSEKFIVPVYSIMYDTDGLVIDVRLFDYFDENTGDGAYIGWGTGRESTTGYEDALLYKAGLSGKYDAWTWTKDAKGARYNLINDRLSVSKPSTIKKDINDLWLAVMDNNQIIGLAIIERDDNEGTLTYLPAHEVGGDIVATVDLSGKVISTKGAHIEGTIDANGNVTISTITPRATVVGTVSFDVDTDGTIKNVQVTITDEKFDVTKVIIMTGEDVTNAEVTFASGATTGTVEDKTAVELKPVAAATTNKSGEIEKVSYDDKELPAGGSITLTDEAGNPIGTVEKDADGKVQVETKTTIASDASINNGTTNNELKPSGEVTDKVVKEKFKVTITKDAGVKSVTAQSGIDLDAVESGTSVTLTITLNENKKIDAVTVNGQTVSVSNNQVTFIVEKATTVDIKTKDDDGQGNTGTDNTTPAINKATAVSSPVDGSNVITVYWYEPNANTSVISESDLVAILKDSLPTLKIASVNTVAATSAKAVSEPDENGEAKEHTVKIDRYFKVTVNGANVTSEKAIIDSSLGSFLPKADSQKITGLAQGSYIVDKAANGNAVEAVQAGGATNAAFDVTANGEIAALNVSTIGHDINLVTAVKIGVDASLAAPTDTSVKAASYGTTELADGSYILPGKTIKVATDSTEDELTQIYASATGKDDAEIVTTTEVGASTPATVSSDYKVELANAGTDGKITLKARSGYKVIIKGVDGLAEVQPGLYTKATGKDGDSNVVKTSGSVAIKGMTFVAIKASDAAGAGGVAHGTKGESVETAIAATVDKDPKNPDSNCGWITLTDKFVAASAVKGVITMVPAMEIKFKAANIAAGGKLGNTPVNIKVSYSDLGVKSTTVSCDTTKNTYVAIGAIIVVTSAQKTTGSIDAGDYLVVTIRKANTSVVSSEYLKDDPTTTTDVGIQMPEDAAGTAVLEGWYLVPGSYDVNTGAGTVAANYVEFSVGALEK